MVKFLLKPVKLKTTVEDGQLESNVQEDALDASVGLLVTTPGEVLQKIEEGSVVPNEIRYLVSSLVHCLVQLVPKFSIFLGCRSLLVSFVRLEILFMS